MSINNPEQHKVSKEQLPPLDATAQVPMQHRDDVNTSDYIRQKFEGPTARVPRAERDDRKTQAKEFGKEVGKTVGKKLLIKAGSTVAGLALLGGIAGGVKLFGGDDSHDSAPNPDQNTSGPANPGNGEVNQGAVGGVTLTAEQATELDSGDEASYNKVIDRAIRKPLADAISNYATGKADSIDLSKITDDPVVAQNIHDTLLNKFPDMDDDRSYDAQDMWVCSANAADPEAFGGGCEDRFSILKVGEPVTLDVMRSTPDDIGADNLTNRPEFAFQTIYLERDGNTLSLVKH